MNTLMLPFVTLASLFQFSCFILTFEKSYYSSDAFPLSAISRTPRLCIKYYDDTSSYDHALLRQRYSFPFTLCKGEVCLLATQCSSNASNSNTSEADQNMKKESSNQLASISELQMLQMLQQTKKKRQTTRRNYVTQIFSSFLVSTSIFTKQQSVNAAPTTTTTKSSISTMSMSTITLPPTLENYFPEAAETSPSSGRSYFPTLVPPLQNRATYRYNLGRNTYALEQLLVFANVTATIRTTVIRLNDGGLWVHSPQYPTGEFCQLLNELGEVKHVVLGCNALEHKAPMKAFLSKYPKASVWISPGQYGPFGKCNFDANEKDCQMGYRVDGIFTPTDESVIDSTTQSRNVSPPSPPWKEEFEYTTLYVSLPENAGPVSEVAFLHKPTNTLITTDSVVYIPDSPPPIFGTYFTSNEMKQDGFWEKTVLQSVFLPLRQVPTTQTMDGGEEGGVQTTTMTTTTTTQWPGYNAIQGKLIRAPILRAFTDARGPAEVRAWVTSIVRMGQFDRIVTSHFASPIRSTPDQYAKAFSYLQTGAVVDSDDVMMNGRIACQDWELLDGLNSVIDENGLGAKVIFDFKADCI